MVKERRSLEEIAKQRGMSIEELVTRALEEGGNPHAAAVLIGVSRPSVKNAMDVYGLEVTTKTVVKKVKR